MKKLSKNTIFVELRSIKNTRIGGAIVSKDITAIQETEQKHFRRYQFNISKIQAQKKMSSIYSSLPLIEDGLEQPLLLTTEDECQETQNNDLYNCDRSNLHDNSLNGSAGVGCWGRELFKSRQFFNGFCLGFGLQTVSLGSTAMIAYYFRTSEDDFPISWMGVYYELSFIVLYVLSQAYKWLLLPIICFSVDSGLTRNQGQSTLRTYFSRCLPSDSDDMPQQSHREAFVGRIQFHVGLVFGCFAVWSMIDIYIGASIRVFAGLTASFFACLGFCYGMIAIYDRFIIDEDDEETRQDLPDEIERI